MGIARQLRISYKQQTDSMPHQSRLWLQMHGNVNTSASCQNSMTSPGAA